MRIRIGALTTRAAVAIGIAALLVSCRDGELVRDPSGTFVQLACMDTSGDLRLNAPDAADPSQLPDFDLNGSQDDGDAAFVHGIDITLDAGRTAQTCESASAPEYLVSDNYATPAEVTCDGDAAPVLLLGVGGGDVNLKDRSDAKGVRNMMDDLYEAYADRDIETLAVVSGPAMPGAVNVHSAMEEWLTNSMRVYLERYPCLRAVLVGHSHGAVTVEVVAARLEDQFADRMIAVVAVDRFANLYDGDTQSRPTTAHVFNIFETNDPLLGGKPYESPNADNWDASSLTSGGEPVTHTNIDNVGAIHDRIVEHVMDRSA